MAKSRKRARIAAKNRAQEKRFWIWTAIIAIAVIIITYLGYTS